MGLILSLLLSMSVAVAQDDGQVAKQFYLNGKMLFEEERYEEAIIAWEKAYEASEKPVILYNIAIAHEKMGRYQQAIDMLYRYRIYATQEEQGELVTKIEALKRSLESEQKGPEQLLTNEYTYDKVQDSNSANKTMDALSESTLSAEPKGSTVERTTSTVTTTSNLGQIPMYAAYGVGIASLGTGVVFGLLANQSSSMAEYAGGCGLTNADVLLCTSDSEGESYFWEAKQRALIADVGYTTSLLSLGTAVWLTYQYAHRSSKEDVANLWLTPSGIGLQGRF